MRLLFAIARAATLAAFSLPPMPLFLLVSPLLCLHSHPLTLCFYFRFLFLYIFLYTVFNFYFVHFYYMPFSLSLLPSASRDPLLCSCGCWGFCGFSVNAKFAQQFAHVPLASELFKGATSGRGSISIYAIYSMSNMFSFFNLTVTKQCVQLCWGRTFYTKPWVE